MKDIGKQYTKDDTMDKTGFKRRARLHQSQYRAKVLKVDHSREKGDDYGNRLSEVDGIKGLNFYPGFNILQAVNEKNKYKYNKNIHSDMLRSEHIPYNLFVPFIQDTSFMTNVFNELMGGCIAEIHLSNDINKLIEYAPSPRKHYLNDGTSFDAYVEYTNKNGERCIIGIEVKYTEHEYPLKKGSKEEAYVELACSPYYKISEASGLYKPNTIEKLKSDLYRQIWRNHLLGESIRLKDNDQFKHFCSMTFFPKGNTHFVEASKNYIDMLNSNDNRFIPINYEDFISACKKHCPNESFREWIKYLEERYIVSNH
jgi:hypothetical protein